MSSTPSSADHTTVDLWVARDSQLRDPAMLEGFSRLLSGDERERVERMRFAAGRHQQLVTRALVRSVLSRYSPEVPPADWRFERSERGKPTVARDMPAAARAWRFNLAHTDGLVVIAVARAPALGVDAERRPSRARLEIARQYFSPAEVAALEALPADDQPARFQRLWTLKEAYLKATGEGIGGGLSGATFHLDGDALRFECAADPDAALWQFREFDLHDDFRVAVACLAPSTATLAVRVFNYPADEA